MCVNLVKGSGKIVELQGVISNIPQIKTPNNLVGLITSVCTINLTEHEVFLVSQSLHALGKQIANDGITNLRKVDMIFTPNGKVELSKVNGPIGNYTAICIYNVGKWRRLYGEDTRTILTIILEELCHHFYTEDEELVDNAVLNVMKNIIPSISLN